MPVWLKGVKSLDTLTKNLVMIKVSLLFSMLGDICRMNMQTVSELSDKKIHVYHLNVPSLAAYLF